MKIIDEVVRKCENCKFVDDGFFVFNDDFDNSTPLYKCLQVVDRDEFNEGSHVCTSHEFKEE